MFSQKYFIFCRRRCQELSANGLEFIKTNIYVYALVSHVFILTVSAWFNNHIEDYPTEGFYAPGLNLTSERIIENVTYTVFGGLMRQDAQKMFHIALDGYTYEDDLAFLPMFPRLIKLAANLFKMVNPAGDYSAHLILSAILINELSFLLALDRLFHLSLYIAGDPNFAFKSTVLFCLNPALVFFISPCSDSLFAYLVFSGMCCCIELKFYRAAIWFSSASLVNSNGLINIVFLYYFLFSKAYKYSEINSIPDIKKYCMIMATIHDTIVCTCLTLFPWLAYHIFSSVALCAPSYISSYPNTILDYGLKNNLTMAFYETDWCRSAVPYLFYIVNQKTWNDRFLDNLKVTNLPYFVLSFPAIFIVLYYGMNYLSDNCYILNRDKDNKVLQKKPPKDTRVLPHSVLPFSVHAIAMMIYCLFFNVQATTRLLASASPFLYWVAATNFILENAVYKQYQRDRSELWRIFPFFHYSIRSSGNIIKLYFLSYAFTGIIVVSNGYPWV